MARTILSIPMTIFVALALTTASGVSAQNTAQPGIPSTKPVIPPPTPEQKALIDRINAMPTDQPAPRVGMSVYLRDGRPNPDFGKTEADWLAAHEQYVKRGKEPVDVVFLGDSITAGWGGQRDLWQKYWGKYRPANFGIGGDKTQHVLWRIEHGALDDVRPKVLVLMIGTNNVGNTPEEILKGTTAVVAAVRAKLPETRILLLSIFPRGELPPPENTRRAKLAQVNAGLAKLDDGPGGKIRYFELWSQFLEPDGKLSRDVMPDFLHLSAKGYQIWADAMAPVLEETMGEK